MERSENKKAQSDESARTLPPELINEILTRLPLKHLSRVQLVSKEWQAWTHDRHMIEKHMSRSPVLQHWHNERREHADHSTSSDKKYSFTYLHGCDGVVVLMNRTLKKYMLWNPAIFRVLELPDPQAGTISLVLMYVSATLGYRIVSFYKKSESGVGCEVLTPGASMLWKPLDFPDVPSPEKPLVVPIGEDVHCVFLTKDGDGKRSVKMVVTLDMEAESFTVNQMDGVVATAVVNWDGKLGFVNMAGETLEVVMLEDYKKQKWSAKKTIVPLPFVNKPGFEGRIRPLANREGHIWFWLEGKEIFSYSIATGKIYHVKKSEALSYESRQIYSYRPSLLRFEGMLPDTDTHLEMYRPKYSSSP